MTEQGYGSPFGVPLTEKMIKFFGFKFSIDEFLAEPLKFREQVDKRFKECPRPLMYHVRYRYSKDDDYPEKDTQYGYIYKKTDKPDVVERKLVTYGEKYPDWFK